MSCPAGSEYQHISDLNYLQTTHERGQTPHSLNLFLNYLAERLYVIFLRRLFQRRLYRIRMNLFHGKLSARKEDKIYFISLNHLGKKSS